MLDKQFFPDGIYFGTSELGEVGTKLGYQWKIRLSDLQNAFH